MAMATAQPIQPSMIKVEPPSTLAMKEEVQQNQDSLTGRIDGAMYSHDHKEEIPLIDIGPSYSNSEAARRAVAARIGAACREVGFFQVANHGVGGQARHAVMDQARRFFHACPPAAKEAMHISRSGLFRGWEPSDASSVNPADRKDKDKDLGGAGETKEAFNWGYEPSLDPTGGDGSYVEMDLQPSPPEGANVWPGEDVLPGFFDAIRQYHGEVIDIPNPSTPVPKASKTPC